MADDDVAHSDEPELPIRTERLVLRRREERDLDDLHSFYGREDVCRWLLHEALSREELAQRLAERADVEQDGFGVVLELDGRVVGEVALMLTFRETAELSWVVHPDAGGRGLVTEAMVAVVDAGIAHYGLHRVWAELDARNTASARMCERLGLRREGHRIADWWSKGEWTDTLQYAVLASEWEQVRPRR